MTMTGRFVENGVRIVAAAALMLAVMFAPIRFTRASQVVPPPIKLPRNLTILTFVHSGQVEVSARLSLRAAVSFQANLDIDNDLEADIEDELTATIPPTTLSFDILPSPCPKPYSELVNSTVALVVRPIRC